MKSNPDMREAVRQTWQNRGRISSPPSHAGEWPKSEVLSFDAYCQGYTFVAFTFPQERRDPYALFDPEGNVIKVWEQPPSLMEIDELTKGGNYADSYER